MFQDIQTESRGFLLVVFCLTNVKLLPPGLTLIVMCVVLEGLVRDYMAKGTICSATAVD